MTHADGAGADAFGKLVERFLAEKPASVEEFLRRHPEHADELREVLPVMEALGEVRRAFASSSMEERRATLERWKEVKEHFAAGVSARGGPQPPGTVARAPEGLPRVLERIRSHGYRSGRFEPGVELARGGQGAVLVVWDGTLQRHLAMKVALVPVDSGQLPSPSAHSLGRFLEEAQVTAQLDHPGIVPVHDLGLDPERRVYFTMKLVKGRDLRAIFELVERGEEGWTRTRALHVLLKVCEAMAYAHSKGVIHRDLKPSNVMVGKFGEVYVMDWGLARVLGVDDRKDIRIRPPLTSELRSLRHEPSDDLDSPLVTMDGDVVGTPAFMPPEQARGELAAMGPHSDVYALGAMLYQLLTGQMPYVRSGARLSNRAVWELVQGGPPAPVRALATDVPAELEAICDKAMAREVTRRYADMGELAEDLRAYLEHRVVGAYETGAIAELRKWVRRNRGLASASVVALVLALAGLSGVGYVKALGKREADRERDVARRERESVLRLSAFQELEDLVREAEELWPPWQEQVSDYKNWLGRAHRLVAGLEPSDDGTDIGHRARLAELEGRALSYTENDRQEDRRSHPRSVELLTRRARLEALERAVAVAEGGAVVPEVALEPAELEAPSAHLAELAWPLVDPERNTFGNEGRGLALARLALEKLEDDERYQEITRLLSWAFLANGLDSDALAEMTNAVFMAPTEHVQLEHRRLEQHITERTAELALQRAELAALEAEISYARTWRFETETDRWWHAKLVQLVEGIEAFVDAETGLIAGISPEHGWGIERRLAWAETTDERTRTGAEARRLWAPAIASISNREECPAYAGLLIEPQLDLLPLGRDPDSGLWEFAHLLTGPAASRTQEGRLELAENSGLVLVLLPGGPFFMGGQASDPNGRNFDARAAPRNGPVREVRLSPFFLSKYEMSQAQWLHFTGRNPSYTQPPHPLVPSLLHPVEQVNWQEAFRTLEHMGLDLCSSAQWEYGARGGTDTVWWTGDDRDSLKGAVNLADQAAARDNHGWGEIADWPELEDGYAWHAPVNHYRPNPFGLHNVHGNVWEWCLDGLDDEFYGRSPVVNPVVPWGSSNERVDRGGGFDGMARNSRSCYFDHSPMESASLIGGLRPARPLMGKVGYASGR